LAQTATIYTVAVELADMDRGVYEVLDLRVALQPSEALEYMVTRLLAYCLEYTEGISFSQGIGAGDEPAIWARDLTGRITLWVEVGLPDSDRLHRASKAADRVAVYTHRSAQQLLGQLAGRKIHRAESIPVYALDRRLVGELASLLERRTSLSLSVTERQLYLQVAGRSLEGRVEEHRIPG
jgi:uncharacterized protein YaeQ